MPTLQLRDCPRELSYLQNTTVYQIKITRNVLNYLEPHHWLLRLLHKPASEHNLCLPWQRLVLDGEHRPCWPSVTSLNASSARLWPQPSRLSRLDPSVHIVSWLPGSSGLLHSCQTFRWTSISIRINPINSKLTYPSHQVTLLEMKLISRTQGHPRPSSTSSWACGHRSCPPWSAASWLRTTSLSMLSPCFL